MQWNMRIVRLGVPQQADKRADRTAEVRGRTVPGKSLRLDLVYQNATFVVICARNFATRYPWVTKLAAFLCTIIEFKQIFVSSAEYGVI